MQLTENQQMGIYATLFFLTLLFYAFAFLMRRKPQDKEAEEWNDCLDNPSCGCNCCRPTTGIRTLSAKVMSECEGQADGTVVMHLYHPLPDTRRHTDFYICGNKKSAERLAATLQSRATNENESKEQPDT